MGEDELTAMLDKAAQAAEYGDSKTAWSMLGDELPRLIAEIRRLQAEEARFRDAVIAVQQEVHRLRRIETAARRLYDAEQAMNRTDVPETVGEFEQEQAYTALLAVFKTAI